MLRTVLSVTFFALCSACSSTNPNPSEALRIANAMGIPAKDLSKEEWKKSPANHGYSATAAARGEMVISSIQSWATDSPSALLLSGFGPKRIESSIHIVAWVPEKYATSPEIAKNIAEKSLQKARAAVSRNEGKDPSEILQQKIKYIMTIPYGEDGPIHAVEQLRQLAIGAAPTLATAPGFIHESQRTYGPIFLDVNGGIASIEEIEKLTEISKKLPSWFYIYNPGLKGVFPNTVINKGNHHLFVSN